MSYTSGTDYDRLPGEAIFINSNLISTEPASVKEKDSAEEPTGPWERRRRGRVVKSQVGSVQEFKREVWENLVTSFLAVRIKII